MQKRLKVRKSISGNFTKPFSVFQNVDSKIILDKTTLHKTILRKKPLNKVEFLSKIKLIDIVKNYARKNNVITNGTFSTNDMFELILQCERFIGVHLDNYEILKHNKPKKFIKYVSNLIDLKIYGK